MGSLISCGQCYTKENNSVVTFSDALVLRLCDGIEVEEEEDKDLNPMNALANLPDSDWFQRIHCIDDSHTAAYDLSYDAFNKLARRIERRLNDLDEVNQLCKSRSILDCYKQNPDCGLNCHEQVQTFVDCVDTVRLKALKKKQKGQEIHEED